MRCSAFLLLCGSLALLSTVTAKKEAIRIYVFDTNGCFGPPDGPNYDVGREKCVNVGTAVSMKAMPLHNDWLGPVNRGEMACWAIPYKVANCPQGQELEPLPIPEKVDHCYTPLKVAKDTIGSVKFACSYMATHSTTLTDSQEFTSWDLDTGGFRFKPHTSTTVRLISLTYVVRDEPTAAPRQAWEGDITIDDTNPLYIPIVARQEEAVKALTTDKQDSDTKYVWMFHPWSREIMCYDCYTKGKKGDYSRFECRSGPHNVVDCGSIPELDENNQPFTHTETVTLLSITTSTIDTTEPTFPVVAPAHRLMKRASGSWHTRVEFENPWIPGNIMCADAEWEKRGQPNSEIRLQKIGNDMKKCKKANAQSLDIPKPFTTRSVIVITTTMLEVHTPTVTKVEASTPSTSPVSSSSPMSTLRRAPFPPHGDL